MTGARDDRATGRQVTAGWRDPSLRDEALVSCGSVTRLAAAVRQRAITAVQVARAHLDRIERHDRQLNAFITVDAEGTLEAADRIDRALDAGRDPGPLAGVPVGVKDILVSRGLRTTCASRMLADWVPAYDAAAVERLRCAGALLIGKTNMDEFAMGSSTERSAFGPCRNPWDLRRVPGGSSGGSAAAVSARLCAAALGSDTGGSIRQPAACCGVVGLKPTYGRVSRYGLIAFASSLDQVGPLGACVDDCAALLQVLAGHDPRDPTSLREPVGDYRDVCQRAAAAGASLEGLRLGVPAEYLGEDDDGLDPQVRSAVLAAIERLSELGGEIVRVSLPHADHAIAAYYLICTAEASSNLARYDGVRYGLRAAGARSVDELYAASRGQGFGAEVKRRIVLGTFALSAGYHDRYYGKAQQVRTLIRRDFDQAWQRCDAIVAPTTPAPAFALGERVDDPLRMYLADVYTTSCNLAGLPGLSLPCGFAADRDARLPVGLQILGPPLGEQTVLRVAAAYEAATDWHRRLPPLFDDRADVEVAGAEVAGAEAAVAEVSG